MAAKKKFKIPKRLGACADKLYETRLARLKLQKEVEALAAEESALKEHFINTLPKSDALGVSGKLARVTIKKKEVPRVENWDKFYKYLQKTGSFELLGRRLNSAAVLERWEDGKKVPGVDHFTAVTVSMNKV